MKILTTSLTLGATLCLSLVGCKPKGGDPQQLSFILEQNAQLKQSIEAMNTTIAQAGDKDPSLTERIQKLEAEITLALKQLNQTGEQETQAQLRILELEARLAQFRSDFEAMQQQITQAAP